MKKRPSILFITLLAVGVISLYCAYRVYHARQLNMRLERFMAGQIIPIQDEWFVGETRPKASEYLVYRDEAFYIYLGQASIEGNYSSYWISQNGRQQQVASGEWYHELTIDPDGMLSWMYQIRPLSGSVVCIMLEAHKPRSWTPGGTGTVGGVGVWTIDTSQRDWQLKPYDSSCEFKDTDLIRTSLLLVR